MFPTLFSIGNFSVSSIGIFLAAGFLYGMFLIWRLARAWDMEEEKTLDLILLTFLGGLVGARIYFVIEHLQLFIALPLNMVLIHKFPGFSFWGGFLGGWLSLYIFAKRQRQDFWQLADIAVVGLLGGLIMSDIGCLLGGCNAGTTSNAFFAIPQEGMIGKRWPVQAIEAVLLAFGLRKIWSQATHFHQRGKIISQGLLYIGVINLILEPLKQNHTEVLFSLVLTILGLVIFYKLTRQNPLNQLQKIGRFILSLVTTAEARKQVVQILIKSWYNQKMSFGWKIRNFKKTLRRSNVKLS